MNIPRHNIPLNRLVDCGIYPRDKSIGRVTSVQYFGIPRNGDRDIIILALSEYIRDTYEGHNIQVFRGRNSTEVKVTWDA